MIDVKTRNGKTDINKMEGTISGICSDLTCIIHAMYSTFKESDEELADLFKTICKNHMMDLAFSDEQDECDECDDKCECKKGHDCDEEINKLFVQMMMSELKKK